MIGPLTAGFTSQSLMTPVGVVKPEIRQLLVDVHLRLRRLVGVGREGRTVEQVAAALRHDVDAQAGLAHVERFGTLAERHLLDGAVIGADAGEFWARAEVHATHALNHLHGVVRAAELQRRRVHHGRPADVAGERAGAGGAERHPRNQNTDRFSAPAAGRQRVHLLPINRRLGHRALDVDERGSTRDRDGFRQLTDPELDVDSRGKTGRQRDAGTVGRGKTLQRKGHRVVARLQTGDNVAPSHVGGRRAHLLRCRIGGFNRDAR